ncbi:MAG: hypothetical protein FWF87_01040 [Synergistaceae bacterium]|nr:hypothetical protein [Synergistaceae bacterium]
MKRFLKSTFFFMFGLSVGLALSWTSFLEGTMKLIVTLTETAFGPWVLAFFTCAVMVIFLVSSIVSRIAIFFENTLKSTEETRRDTIKECVKLTFLELENTKKRNTQKNSKKGCD